MASLADVKAQMSCAEYATNTLGWRLRNGRCAAHYRGGTNPTSMLIGDRRWYDFARSRGGDIFDLCAVARHDGDLRAAIRELAGPYESDHWLAAMRARTERAVAEHAALRPEHRDYLHRRGITDATIDALRIGFDGSRLSFPYLGRHGGVIYRVTRALRDEQPKYKKDRLDGTNENAPWGLDTIERETSRPLAIAEGVFDALSFWQDGWRVLSPFGGHFGPAARACALEICEVQDSVLVVFDSDEAGSSFECKFSRMLAERGVSFKVGRLPDGVKDVSDYYAAGGSLDQLAETAIDGRVGLLDRAADVGAFERELISLSRGLSASEIGALLDVAGAAERFGKTAASALFREASSPPTADRVTRELTSRSRLRWSAVYGFHEYKDGAWRRRGDESIAHEVGRALGRHRTGSRIDSVMRVLRADVTVDAGELYNRARVMNFANGALELDTGKFRPHREDDLATIVLPYPYEPEARARELERFIETVTAADDPRARLLQEAAGYVLFPDNCLQTCFFLIGAGANGKSVYLDLLRRIYGEENTTSVEMTGLADCFQRVLLADSMLNISTETRSDAEGAETYFKQIVTGDVINGSFKYRDVFQFRPRAKLFLASNGFMTSRDVSHGFTRRLKFIGFPVTFSTEPKAGEMPADLGISERLAAELPGAFNWAYEGYRRLREVGAFTKSPRDEQIADEYRSYIDPIKGFIEDSTFSGRIDRPTMYAAYRSWCLANGHKPMSSTHFTTNFRCALKRMGVKFLERKNNSTRYWLFDD